MADYSKVGITVSNDFLVHSFSIQRARNFSKFASLVLEDSDNARVDAKIWGYELNDPDWLQPGKVIRVSAAVDSYNGKPQLKIQSCGPSDKKPTDFARNTTQDIDKMWDELVQTVSDFDEPMTRFVAEEVLLEHKQAIQKAPAAKSVHNNWYGGLIEHVYSLVQLGKAVSIHYERMYGKTFSRDKLLFGLMLHDIGKIIEYNLDTPNFELTTLGQLTPHIVASSCWVFDKCRLFLEGSGKDVSSDLEVAHLVHLIASHHGQLDWGSPVKPASLEAILVHHLDNLDSKFMHALDLVRSGPDRGFKDLTARSYFEGVRYLIPNEAKNDTGKEDGTGVAEGEDSEESPLF